MNIAKSPNIRSAGWLFTLVVLLGVAAPDTAQACGGFFCSTFPMNQVSESILFVVGDGVVTTHVQIQYDGEASDFAWILPVPSPPDLQVTHNQLFRQLTFATQPFFFLNWDENQECGLLWQYGPEEADGASTDDGGVQVISSERVGPYDTVVISADEAASITTWLADNGYELGDLGPDLLQPYIDDGFYFLALRLAPDKEVGDLQPIAMTYEAEHPGIPIKLTAVATQPNLGVLTWVLGSERAIPSNYLHVEINEARIDWFNGGFNYPDVVTEAADEAGGQAFATDYAGSSSIMEDLLFVDGRFDVDELRLIGEPIEYLDTMLRQGFPRDSQTQALLRRHLPMPQRVLEEGVLQVVYGGDSDRYDEDNQAGLLLGIAERSFYNNISAYGEWLTDVQYDLEPLTDDLRDIVVEPLRAAQDLFGDFPYLTRLYTTLSAEEMTVDPMFSFNPDLPEVSNLRSAGARWECPDGEDTDPEDIVLVITLSDGREIRSNPYAVIDPDANVALQPAAILVQRMDESGPPETVFQATNIGNVNTGQPRPSVAALLPNYPNPFNSGTVLPILLPQNLTAGAEYRLRIFNLLGQPVRTLVEGRLQPGYNTVKWNGLSDTGRPVPSGAYFYRLEAGDQVLARKLLVLR